MRLAGSLLSQAAAADRDGQPGAQTAGCVEVAHAGGESYAITTRGHALLADQPIDEGARDAAATPTELFVGSLASCVAFYTGRYLLRHGLEREVWSGEVLHGYDKTGLRVVRIRSANG